MGCIFGARSLPDAADENDGPRQAKSGGNKTKRPNKAGEPTASSNGRPKSQRSPSVVFRIQIEHFISPHQEEQLEIDIRAGIREKSPMKFDGVLSSAGQLYQSPLHPSLLAVIIRVAVALVEHCNDQDNGQIVLREGLDNANYQIQEDREKGLMPGEDEALDDENKQLQEIQVLIGHMQTILWAWSSGDPAPDVDLKKYIIEPRPMSVDSFSIPADIRFQEGMSDSEMSSGGGDPGSRPTAGDSQREEENGQPQSYPQGDENPDLEEPVEPVQPPQQTDDSGTTALSSRTLHDLIQSAKTTQAESDIERVTNAANEFVQSKDGDLDAESLGLVLEWCAFLHENGEEEMAMSLRKNAGVDDVGDGSAS